MFGKQRTTTVVKTLELSDETRQALTSLENDLQVLGQMLTETLAVGRSILGALAGQIASEIAEVGVQAFADEISESPLTAEGLPRERRSAFRRRPRSEQYAEIMVMLADGEWHNAFEEAKRLAGDEREFRYLRGALSGCMKELYDDGKLERRDCAIRGAMFEYRRIPSA